MTAPQPEDSPQGSPEGGEIRYHMMSGYCFVWEGEQHWSHRTNDEDWATEVYTPTRGEHVVGGSWIDGSYCTVFICPDEKFRAQTAVATGG